MVPGIWISLKLNDNIGALEGASELDVFTNELLAHGRQKRVKSVACSRIGFDEDSLRKKFLLLPCGLSKKVDLEMRVTKRETTRQSNLPLNVLLATAKPSTLNGKHHQELGHRCSCRSTTQSDFFLIFAG
eukprot:1137603-Pelagomonas_calceolata.AAC.4